MEELEHKLTCFEVETIYKSGRKRTEVIISKDETSMWKFYGKHHKRENVSSCAIVDVWSQ